VDTDVYSIHCEICGTIQLDKNGNIMFFNFGIWHLHIKECQECESKSGLFSFLHEFENV